MTDDRSNWTRAVESLRMRTIVHDLILIGQTLGVDVAERMYYNLRDEPRDAHGNRIDWLQIRAWIETIA